MPYLLELQFVAQMKRGTSTAVLLDPADLVAKRRQDVANLQALRAQARQVGQMHAQEHAGAAALLDKIRARAEEHRQRLQSVAFIP